MHTNRFLPPPVRLSQALDDDLPSAAAHPVTRRSFMKRTGGATVATLVAWNLATKEMARAETGGDSGGGTDSQTAYIWGLVCVADPSIVGTAKGEHGNDGAKHPDREWFYRNVATWPRDNGVAIEIRGKGPVACAKDSLGNHVITDADVRGSFTVRGRIKAYISNDIDDGDPYWGGVFDGDEKTNDNVNHDMIALDEDGFPDATLSIDRNGNVSFVPVPLVFTSIQDNCKLDFFDPLDNDSLSNLKFQLIGGGGVTPAMQVIGGAARANIDDTTWEMGFSVQGGLAADKEGGPEINAGITFKLTFKHLPISTQRTLSWNFHKVRRWKMPDGSTGPWEDMGFAWPSNVSLENHQLPPPYRPSSQ